MRGKLILTAAALLGAVWFVPPVNADTVYMSDMGLIRTIESPIIYRTVESRVVEPTVIYDTTPTVVTPTLVAPSPTIMVEPDRSHFLRFGVGPLLDFGLF
jgi:hypothetical protein